MSEIVKDLPISRLYPHPGNVRGGIAPDEAEEMALSILLMGVIQPLVATTHNGEFRVVDGHVRLAGAMRLLETNRWPQDRPQTLPVIVRDHLTPEQQQVIMLSSNVVRYALNPVDEGLAYLRMVQEEGLNKSAVADRCGVSPGRVESRLCIVGLAPPVVELFRRGKLPLGAAGHLAQVDDHKTQVDLANTLLEMDAIRLDTIAEACRQVVKKTERKREAKKDDDAGGDGGENGKQRRKARTGGGNGADATPPVGESAASRADSRSPRGQTCEGGALGLAELQVAAAQTCGACPSRDLPGKLPWARAERIWMEQCHNCEVADLVAGACDDCPLALFLDKLLGEDDDS
jgi:ParB family chromosome partitioning protein